MSDDSIELNGARLCNGQVEIGGFKHALVSVISCAVAVRARIEIVNAPEILETEVLAELLVGLGGAATRDGARLSIDCANLSRSDISSRRAEEIHGSLYLVPALLMATGCVSLGPTGGCQIGDDGPGGGRPVKHMLSVLRQFGATFVDDGEAGQIVGRLSEPRPCDIDIAAYSSSRTVVTGPAVSGATKTALIAAAGAARAGPSRIANAYDKPDVTDALRYLRAAGFGCTMRGREIVLASRPERPEPLSFALTDDLSEVMTWICLAKVAGIEISIPLHSAERVRAGLRAELELCRAMALTLDWRGEVLVIPRQDSVRAVDIEVTSRSIYSDHQPLFALLFLCLGDGPGRIVERVWTTRFSYVPELRKMGARIQSGEGWIEVHPSRLQPPREPLLAADLRAAATLMIAGLAARQPFRLSGWPHLLRGYSRLGSNLRTLGAEGQLDSLESASRGNLRAPLT